MSSKHVYSLSDDNRELQRQIGCMNGIFNIFDRHHFFSGRRHGGRNQKRLPPAAQIANPEYNSVTTPQTGKATGEETKEQVLKHRRNQRTSFESPPRTSLSSSLSSSTYSSLDNNRTNQAEPSPSKTMMNSRNQSIDLRDVVKDSIYKEPQRLVVRKTNRGSSHTLKHIDSPRPSLPSKYAPRFSYDGRESRDKWTSTMKIKELPRLSLDSKQGSSSRTKSNYIFAEERKEIEVGIHKRSSSVVAKLMGLEGLSDSVSSEIVQPIEVKSSYRHDDNLETTPRPAPWKNQEGVRNSPKLELQTRSRSSPPSVYGQIEKRLTDLEFKSSGKDLRALKQILEAMEKTRERLEIKNEEKKPIASKNIESSSIVVMKPAMFTEKRTSGLRKNISPVDKIQSHVKTTKSMHSSRLHQQPLPKSPTSCRRSTSPVSPRMLQSHGGNQSPESSCRVRRQQYNQTIDQSYSPGRKIKLKSFNSKKGDKSATRSQQGDVASVQSDSNISIVSQSDTEIQSTDHMEEVHSLYRQSRQDIREQLRKDTIEFTTIEQPSPISVLDATFYREGSPSPVRKISNAFRDDETQNSEEIEWNTVEFDNMLKPTVFTQEKLENINQLVHKLRELNNTNGETEASYIAYNSKEQKPDHSYITQILLASGLLLKDLRYSSTFMQLKPSDQLLNPNLFLVLEQTKGNNIQQPSDISEKIHRKLIFDIVNEILVEKISRLEYSKPQKCQTGQKLLKEVCSEVDHLQARANCSLLDEDDYFNNILSDEIMRKSENWIDFRSETPALVLDIERLIFKDIINELVRGEEVNSKY
ncbi:protein LONGIFOLIA 1-like [Impatiens glandulifera]|uniref:protein LONGIFOLIA 1-like n=1 Tax=Impatiens glandulifera TaxID=253017 RepID=UPI001FB18D0F|nr:protein LONGIFOLIA 1-like [Impatiens glandulifera]